MPLPVIRYSLDKTGLSSNNYIAGEAHVLEALPKRAVVPTYGSYFTESLRVYDAAGNNLLVRGTDYICIELEELATELYGKEICFGILVVNPAVSANVRLNYQVLGGDYTRQGEAIVAIYNLIENGLQLANVTWPNIIAKPQTFAPGPHFHNIDDIYGFQYISQAMQDIANAIVLGRAPAFESILSFVQTTLGNFQQTVNIQALNSKLPAISSVSGNLITAYSDGLYYSGAAPSPSPTPAPSPTAVITGMQGFFPVTTAPTGWLKANGAVVSRTTYNALFAVIGTSYGAGDGSTTFKLPDWRGLFTRALDDGRGYDASRVINTEQASANLAHTHTVNGSIQLYGAPNQGSGVLTQIGGSDTGSSGGGESRPINIALLACIRY